MVWFVDLENCNVYDGLSPYIYYFEKQQNKINLANMGVEIPYSIKEAIKYTTQHGSCIINGLARPINSGHGYDVR